MISHVKCRSILNRVSKPDNWFGLWYNMNLYRGCAHRCIYCDSRSECYSIENFDGEILVKANAIDLLTDRLPRLRVKGTIGTGSMNDPYQPLEKKIGLTRRALEVIAMNHFPVHIITKSDLVLRDIDILEDIARVFSAVTFTITSVNTSLASRLEPGAPPVEARFDAIRELSLRGIHVGITLMPILPFITDTIDNLNGIIEQASRCGAEYIIASFGVTLRDRQRDYFLRKVEKLFPGMSIEYNRQFGSSYLCRSRNAEQLETVFTEKCHAEGISTSMPVHDPLDTGQLSLF